LKLELYGYAANEIRQLVKFFHLRLPEEVQMGWDKYWAFTWRMFDTPDPKRREEFAEATRRLRRRLLTWWLVGVGMIFVGAILLWRYTGDSKSLKQLGLLIFLLPLLMLAFFASVGGRIGRHPDVQRSSVAHPVLIIGWAVLMSAFLVPIPIALVGSPVTARYVFFGTSAIGCLITVIGLWPQNRRTRQASMQGAKLAEQEYMRPDQKRGTGKPLP
jgi:hypothetical protein